MENKKELKTLKDIIHKDFYDFEKEIVNPADLKQLAIKWLRYFQSGNIKTDLQREGIIEFILNFFNINDEDLKNGKQK